ncbi:MAG: hypothetical protein O3C43_15780 [Verrucomicrobia bacterium]|nr:hypothetical protein [Verrucomicrobiota bacterium]MDA1067952.1 hypothetical protein [Verrucomicrobiota bacterium]
MNEVIVQGMPDSLRHFIIEECAIPATAFKILTGEELPEPSRQLMFHLHDMTSTLEKYHRSKIYIDCLQHKGLPDIYLREVFLRIAEGNAIVEYGVIAIVLDSFNRDQQSVIEADREPFGGLLKKFCIVFESAPVCFFSISAEYLVDTPFKELKGETFYGRFNKSRIQLTSARG